MEGKIGTYYTSHTPINTQRSKNSVINEDTNKPLSRSQEKDYIAIVQKYVDAGQHEEALPYLLVLVKNNNQSAQYVLAEMYHYGRGVPKNPVIAFTHYQAVAQQGNANAQRHMGLLAEEVLTAGLSDLKSEDYPAAHHKFLLLAEEKNEMSGEAQFQLGKMHLKGLGLTEKDPLGAIEYFLKANENALFKAPFMIAKSYLAIPYFFSQEESHLTEAVKWYKVASAKGDTQADQQLVVLSEQYRKRTFVSKEELNTANALLTFAVNAGCQEALDKKKELEENALSSWNFGSVFAIETVKRESYNINH